jgi:hypothetical protein
MMSPLALHLQRGGSAAAMRKRARYRGKVCKNHPELNGLRYRCSSACTECARIKRREQVARAKLKQQAYLARAERALKIVCELGLEDRL